MVAAHFFEGNEFVEHVVVEHELHGFVGRVGLQSEEAFGGVVSLHIVHLL